MLPARRQGGQRSSEKQERARTRICREACGAGEAVGTCETCGVCGVCGVCESCAGVPLPVAKKKAATTPSAGAKKKLRTQKFRSPAAAGYPPTSIANRQPAQTNSGTSPARRTPCKIPTFQCHLPRRWPVSTPSTAALISLPTIPTTPRVAPYLVSAAPSYSRFR